MAPSNTQWDDAVRHYCLDILKVRDVAVLGDTTGYGTTAVGASVAAFKKDGANVAYQAQIDATQPDVTPDLLRARNAGAKAVVIWSVTTGMMARLMNVRATLGWDVPFVGHPSLGSGDVRALLDKPSNWDKVYMIGYRSCSYDPNGKLPPRTGGLRGQARRQGGIERHVAVVGRLRLRCGLPLPQGGDREGRRGCGYHRILEHDGHLCRHLRRLHLDSPAT